MEKYPREKNRSLKEDSLGKLNMDKLKVFGEIQTDCFNITNKSTNVNKRLSMERTKALETLQKSQRMDSLRKLHNKENMNTNMMLNGSPLFNNTEYVVPYPIKSINISDLVTDETIHLISNDTTSPVSARASASISKDTKISFEPTEITGRSTVYISDFERSKSFGRRMPRLSVNDIVSSSFAMHARTLGDTLEHLKPSSDTINVMRDIPVERIGTSSRSSFTSLNTFSSLPRTADLSKAIRSEESLRLDDSLDIRYTSDNFAPGELMHSKLLADEISWSKEFAIMPATALSDEANNKISGGDAKVSGDFDINSAANSIVGADPNFSVGTFFNVRSDDILNLVELPGQNKIGTPIALVEPTDDEDDETVSTTNPELRPKNNSNAPRNKTYKLDVNTISSKDKNKAGQKRESKDSGNSSANSFLLSMSTIDKLLNDMNIHANDSESGVVNALLQKAKPSQDQRQPYDNERRSLSTSSATEEYDGIAEIILENKENLDPKMLCDASLSDTKSFTESLLNSSDMKRLQKDNSLRLPLSPIGIETSTPKIQITDADNDGDIDEWPSTPIKPPHRRVRRTKSPEDSSPKDRDITRDATLTTKSPLPIDDRQLNGSRSERVDSNNDPSADAKSFNGSQQSGQSDASNSNNNSNNNADIAKDTSTARSGSPRSLNNSPMLSLSGLSSPVNCGSPVSCTSPQLDSTTNSERRYLGVGAVGRFNSSPTTSESSGRGFGVVRSRSCLCSSPKNDTAATMRSISRCSSSSEFSHRDGKAIPLKVSNLHLSWGSTKLRREVRRSLQVKNISNKRLVVRIEVHGPGFQVVNVRGNMLTLQSQECRTITVQFCPTIIGVAIGMISFHAPQGTMNTNAAFMEIPLYGYGGHASIAPKGILQGPIGYPFLVMGELGDLARPLERTFFICNNGPLLGFAMINVDSIGLNLPRLSNAFEVRPKKMLIPPKKMITVHIRFHPKRDDIKNIIKKITNVLTLSNMRIIYGDESNRQRMRRLMQRMSPEEREKLASRTLDKLWSTFQDEPEMPELNEIRESNDVIMDLMQCVNVKEIALTINHYPVDETLETSSLYLPDADDTVLFRTICMASPTLTLDPVAEYGEKHCDDLHAGSEAAVSSSTRPTSWSVSPSVIEIDFDSKRRRNHQIFTIRNTYKSRQYFDVACNQKDVLSFIPSEGYLEPDGGEMQIKVRTELNQPPQLNMNESLQIMVCMENERITLPVRIASNSFPAKYLH